MPLLTCPNCQLGMQEIRRNEVLLDTCPQCRGVWLDRGELEKILNIGRQVENEWERERESYYRQQQKPHYYKKKKHWIFDLFD
ncbi:MAG: zf-TFIIB domain-containing protein [Deltaproteobacteria bacterium]|nr:zf-TFIIB domain-containing protein [Deltaproteobacteria bacterium]